MPRDSARWSSRAWSSMRSTRGCARSASGIPWTSRRRRRPRWAAWRATTRAARARSPTATAWTAWKPSTRGCRTACAAASATRRPSTDPAIRALAQKARALWEREQAEIAARTAARGAPRRGLQPRPPRPATLQPREPAGGQRRHARMVRAHPHPARGAAAPQGARGRAFPALPRRHGRRPAHREAGALGRGARRSHDDRPRARQRRLRARHPPLREGRARRDPAGGVLRWRACASGAGREAPRAS